MKPWYVLVCALFGLVLGLQWAHFLYVNQRMEQFVAKGPRFTAQDGYALCLRVQALERAQGLKIGACASPEMP